MSSRRPCLAAALLCTCLVAGPTRAAPSKAADREALKKTLLDLAQRAFRDARLGLQLVSLDDGSVVFSKDADALMNPASNVKLVTAAAALARLGPEYRFDTEFLVEPGPSERVKTLWVRGKGDPSITTERLHAMASELSHLGLREVGELVLDDTWFDAERLAPGFEQDISDRAYTTAPHRRPQPQRQRGGGVPPGLVARRARGGGAGAPRSTSRSSTRPRRLQPGSPGVGLVPVDRQRPADHRARHRSRLRRVGGLEAHRQPADVLRVHLQEGPEMHGIRVREAQARGRPGARAPPLRGPERDLRSGPQADEQALQQLRRRAAPKTGPR